MVDMPVLQIGAFLGVRVRIPSSILWGLTNLVMPLLFDLLSNPVIVIRREVKEEKKEARMLPMHIL